MAIKIIVASLHALIGQVAVSCNGELKPFRGRLKHFSFSAPVKRLKRLKYSQAATDPDPVTFCYLL